MKSYRCCDHCSGSGACKPRYYQAMLVRPPRDEHPYACLLCAVDEPGRQLA